MQSSHPEDLSKLDNFNTFLTLYLTQFQSSAITAHTLQLFEPYIDFLEQLAGHSILPNLSISLRIFFLPTPKTGIVPEFTATFCIGTSESGWINTTTSNTRSCKTLRLALFEIAKLISNIKVPATYSLTTSCATSTLHPPERRSWIAYDRLVKTSRLEKLSASTSLLKLFF